MKFTSTTTALQALAIVGSILTVVDSKLADRSRIVKARQESGKADRYHDNGRPIEGQSYRSTKMKDESSLLPSTSTQRQPHNNIFKLKKRNNNNNVKQHKRNLPHGN